MPQFATTDLTLDSSMVPTQRSGPKFGGGEICVSQRAPMRVGARKARRLRDVPPPWPGGWRVRRGWRTPGRMAVMMPGDAATHEIVAAELTSDD